MHIKVKDLHEALQRALEAVNYRRPDVSIEARPEASMFVGGGTGQKGFAILVELDSNRHQIHWGSWGGSNMFNPRNAVDLDTSLYQLPPNGAVITGSKGATVHASIVVHPDLFPSMLPAPVKLNKQERDCLYCYKALKGGQYRHDELMRRNVPHDVIDAMVERGFLKRNAAGSVQITTEGKNALGDYQGW